MIMSWLLVAVFLYIFVCDISAVSNKLVESTDNGTSDSVIGRKKNLAGEVSLSKLLEKIEEQEVRLRRLQEEQKEDSEQKAFMIEQLKAMLASNVNDLMEKDRRIDQLENELIDLKNTIREEIFFDVNDIDKVTNKVQPYDEKPAENGTTNIFTKRRSQTETDLQMMTYTRKEISKRVGEYSSGVAFSVSLSTNVNMFAHEVIKYNAILLDTANGYNHRNGIYEVPEGGVYVFTWSTTSGTNDYRSMTTEILINGSVQSSSLADSSESNWGSATGLVVTSVSKGDHVYTRQFNAGQIISVSTAAKSTFSGWRLF